MRVDRVSTSRSFLILNDPIVAHAPGIPEKSSLPPERAFSPQEGKFRGNCADSMAYEITTAGQNLPTVSRSFGRIKPARQIPRDDNGYHIAIALGINFTIGHAVILLYAVSHELFRSYISKVIRRNNGGIEIIKLLFPAGKAAKDTL